MLEWNSVCRFPLGTSAVVFFIMRSPEGTEALRVLCDDHRFHCFVLLIVANAVWALSTFFFSRILLRFDSKGRAAFEPDSPGERWRARLALHGPRVLGVCSFGIVALALAMSSDHWLAEEYPRTLTLITLALGVAFGMALWTRWLDRDPTKKVNDVRALPIVERVYAVGMGLVFASTCALFIAAPVATGAMLGAPSVLFLAAAAWNWAGSILTFIAQWRQLPAFAALFAWIWFCNYRNDNHAVSLVSSLAENKEVEAPTVTAPPIHHGSSS